MKDFQIDHQQFRHYLENNLNGYFDILRQMVSINSFTTNAEGVNELGVLTGRVFSNLGFEAERVAADNPCYGHHLFLSRPGTAQNGPTIALVSHLDTVFPPEEEERNNFSWRVESDRIYGPGTVDIKGGTVVMYMVLDGLKALAPAVFDAIDWHLLFNAAEETLAPEFGTLCRERIPGGALACLVYEGGRRYGNQYSLVTARKGMTTFEITAEGRAAHAGASHKEGANAIVQLAQTILQAAALTDYDRNLTVNVGTVQGGTVINRVPHSASAAGEMRSFEPEVMDQAVAELLALKGGEMIRSFNGVYPCQIDTKIVYRWQPWPPNKGTGELLAVFQEAAGSLGWQIVPEERGGLSDGNLLWDYVPTIDGLGPIGENAHCSERSADGSKDQEYVAIDSLVPKAMLSIVAISRLLNS